MYTIGKLSAKTGVTVRTLDYYDEIGLIKPSTKTDGGHRIYDNEDIMRLERVLALKYIGFSLEQIKDMLHDTPSSWQQSIQQQLEMVEQEQERLKILKQTLQALFFSIAYEDKLNWEMVFHAIKLFQQDPEDFFQDYQAYLNTEDMEKIIEMNAQISKEDMEAWVKVNSDIKNNLNLDPTSKEAWQLAERWIKQSDSMFDHDETLQSKIGEALNHLKDGMVFYPIDQDIIHFLSCAYEAKYGKGEKE